MDDFEADPWAKQTPETEKSNSLETDVQDKSQGNSDVLGDDDDEPQASFTSALPPELHASTSSGSIVEHNISKDKDEYINDDQDAWDAGSDDEAAIGADEEFVEATSRMSLNNSLVAEDQQLQSPMNYNNDNITNAGNNALPSASPLAGSSKLPSTFSSGFDSIDASTSSPPLDDFDDDDGFGDFGEPRQAGVGGDDDDDFGAFDEAGQGTAANDFDFDDPPAAQPALASTSSSTSANAAAPIDFLPCNIDFESLLHDKEAFTSTLQSWIEQADPHIYDGVDRSQEDRDAVDRIDLSMDPKDIILSASKTAKDLYEKWSDEKTFPYEPFEFKRSQIRLAALREQGIPVNLDDFAPPKKMATLVLPSIHTTAASPTRSRHASTSGNGERRSATLSRSSSPSRNPRASGSTPSSPARSPARASSGVVIPPIDMDTCQRLANVTEEAMKMRAIGELELLRQELQSTAIEASQHLTALLEKKEILTGQNETYNAMIQDLVLQAQKLRSSSSPGASTSRKPSLKRTPSNASKPPSRPSSPANTGLKSSLGRNAAAQSSSAGKEPTKRSSLW